MFLLNSLKTPDIVFFVLIGVIVVVCIAIYFLIPVIKRKEYAERRENLKKREAIFRANLKNLQATTVKIEENDKAELEEKPSEAIDEKENNDNK